MIGCMLLGFAGVFIATRMVHRAHHWHAWHHGRGMGGCGAGGGGWYGDDRGPGGWGGHGHGYGFGGEEPANDDGPGWGDGPRWMRGGFGRGFALRALAEQLDATPAQEKVIRDATDDFRETIGKLKGEGRKTRDDVAGSFRKSNFDEVFFGELFARHDRSIEEVRKAFVGMGARIHEALDERQRARLADLIEAGPHAWRRWGGGRRGWRARA
jgi:Heavy-metal resistance